MNGRVRVGWVSVVLGLALGAAFLTPLLLAGPIDTEEVPLGVFASQIHYRALLRGDWLFWFNDLGFGTPMPIGHRFDAHPVMALSAVMPLRVALSAFWAVHIALMVVYFLRLAADLGIRPALRVALLACYLFSATSVFLFYLTDWASSIFGWSLMPMLVFYLRRLVQAEAGERTWLQAMRLGLVAGWWLINAHPGYITPLVIALGVYTIAAAGLRPTAWLGLAVAFVVGAAIAAERLYYVATEVALFPGDLPRSEQPAYLPAEWLRAAMYPFVEIDQGMRMPFIGAVAALAALASLASLGRRGDRHLRPFAIACAVAAALSLVPELESWTPVSAGWLFRDAVIFFGLLAGGVMLQRALDVPRRWVQALVCALVVVQLVQQASVVSVARQVYDDHHSMHFYRSQGQPTGFAQTLAEHGRSVGPRIYLSAEAQALARGNLADHGIYFVTDLALLGLNPINAWFKGVSMDSFYPSSVRAHGYIVGQTDVIANADLLDVLGVDLVLTTAMETPAPAGLTPLVERRLETRRGFFDFVLLGNPEAWPQAVLLDPSARQVEMPVRDGCGHERALCRDFAAFARTRLPGDVEATTEHGRYQLRFAAGDRDRLLFLSAFYRPEWQASWSGGPLEVTPVAGGFIGVTVPRGVDHVDLAFVPGARIALAWVSMLSLLAACLVVAVGSWRARRVRRDAALRRPAGAPALDPGFGGTRPTTAQS